MWSSCQETSDGGLGVRKGKVVLGILGLKDAFEVLKKQQ